MSILLELAGIFATIILVAAIFFVIFMIGFGLGRIGEIIFERLKK
jgi:hypothetical protein